MLIRLKEKLIQTVYASTKDLKETKEEYQKQIKSFERVNYKRNQSTIVSFSFKGNGKGQT